MVGCRDLSMGRLKCQDLQISIPYIVSDTHTALLISIARYNHTICRK
jgi:hypothetical protein